jgi:beta-N-acetylglucosaminidase
MNKVLKTTIVAMLLLIPAFFLVPKAEAASPPLVCIDTPAQSQSFSTGGNLIRVSGWAIAPAGVRSVTVRMEGSDSPYLNYTIPASAMPSRTDVASAMSSYPGASGNKAFEVYFNTNNIGNGPHNVIVTVTDVNGVTTTSYRTINLVSPLPGIVYIDWPTANQTYYTGGKNIRIAGWVIAAAGVKSVTVRMEGSNSPYLNYTIPASSMASRADIASLMSSYPGASDNKAYEAYFNTNNIGVGPHNVIVTVTDVNGATTTTSTIINLVPPPPSIVYIDWPSLNQCYGNDSIVRVAGWVISPNGVSSVTVKVDGSDAPNLSCALPASSMASRADITSSMSSYPGASGNKAYEAYFNTNHITPGTHTVYVYVTDTNGNITYTGKTITVTKPPSHMAFDNVQAVINGTQVVTNNMTGSFTLNGYALNPSTVSSIAVYLDDQYQGNASLTGPRADVLSQFPTYPASNDTGFSFTYTPDLSKYSPGSHTLKAIATGYDGSTTTLTRTVVKLSPVLYVLPDSTMPYANYNGSSDISIIGFALDDSIVNKVSVSLDGTDIPGVSTSISSSDVQAAFPQYPGSSSAKFSAVIPKGMLSNGIHIISVTSKGTDGVTQTRQIAITVGGSTYNTSYPITLTNLLTKEQSIAAGYGFTVGASDIDPYLVQGEYNGVQSEYNGYEFLSLKYGLGGTGSTLTATQLETMIPAMAYDSQNNYENLVSDILSTHAQAFIDAANTYGINPVYLVAHALEETGHGTSLLANGYTYTDGKTYYNMFGIGADDAAPITGGRGAAIEYGWDSVDKAITGGAQWIATHYINSVSIHAGDGKQHYDQDTLYEMKWDPCAVSTFQSPYEYATEPDWAYNIARIMYQNRNLLTGTNMTLVYDIPKYN